MHTIAPTASRVTKACEQIVATDSAWQLCTSPEHCGGQWGLLNTTPFAYTVCLCSLVGTLSPFAGMQHLDVAGGTGDVAFRVLRAIHAAEAQQQGQPQQQVQPQQPQQQSQQVQQQPVPGHVTVFDINAEMLEVGKRRAQEQGEAGQHCISGQHCSTAA